MRCDGCYHCLPNTSASLPSGHSAGLHLPQPSLRAGLQRDFFGARDREQTEHRFQVEAFRAERGSDTYTAVVILGAHDKMKPPLPGSPSDIKKSPLASKLWICCMIER